MSSASHDSSGPLAAKGPVFFERRELDQLLRVYGRLVAAGDWRDYSLVGGADVAEFAVYARSGDAPSIVSRNVRPCRADRASGP